MRSSFRIQTLLILAATFTVSFVVLLGVQYLHRKQEILDASLSQARDIRAILMATRHIYHRQFLDSGLPLNDATLGFLPAHALSNISKDFPNWSKTGLSFNNVSDRPRNPANAADARELESMAYFRANPTVHERSVAFTDAAGRSYFHISMPIYVEEYCLACHGAKSDAPPTIQANYETAYDYKLGELRGLMSIKLPVDEIEATLWRDLTSHGIVYLLTLLASLSAIYTLLNRQILRHMDGLVNASGKVARRDFDIHLPATGEDKIDQAAAGFNAMARVLREREEEQQRLRAEAQRYQALMESVLNNTTSVIYIKGLDGRYRFVNRAYEDLFHISREEIRGKCDSDLFPKNQADAFRANDLKAAAGEHPVEFEEIVPHDDGEHTYISVKFPLPSASGETDAVCGVSTDITERIAAEHALRERAAVWDSLMSSTSEGILGVDPDGVCTFCNPAALRLLGYGKVEELVGKDTHSLIHTRHAVGDNRPPEPFRISATMAAGKTELVEDELLRRADARLIPVTYRSTPIHEAERVTGVVVTFDEISERLEAQQALRERLGELEQFNRLAIGRELRMVELKKEINALLREQGGAEKYRVEE